MYREMEGYNEMNLMEHYLVDFMKRFDEYPFCLNLEGKQYLMGKGEPEFTVNFHKEIPHKDLITSTSLSLGEAYMRGDLEIEGDLFFALDHFLGQMGKFSTDHSALKKLIHSSVSKRNQKREVCSHYDIGNDFYQLWLDETMSYSCGYFKEKTNSLYEAQVNKVDYILKKLHLEPNMTLLDIGCGWGFLLIQAAKKYNIKGMGITLSKEQKKKFDDEIKKNHLEGQVKVELMDYRELEHSKLSFHRVVSVGMLEHVGRDNYERYIRNVNSVLKEEGLFLLHYISALKEHPGDPWIKKYIFPGGMVPSLREMIQLLGDYEFYTLDVESLRRHYYQTLRCWSQNFNEHKKEIQTSMGDEFLRMWDLYLCSCAATFHNGIIDLHQILLSKGVNNRLPMTRWY